MLPPFGIWAGLVSAAGDRRQWNAPGPERGLRRPRRGPALLRGIGTELPIDPVSHAPILPAGALFRIRELTDPVYGCVPYSSPVSLGEKLRIGGLGLARSGHRA